MTMNHPPSAVSDPPAPRPMRDAVAALNERAAPKGIDHRSAACPADGDGSLIVFAGGGTGGHLYPALAVAAALRQLQPGVRLAFSATDRPIDRQILAEYRETLVPQPVRPFPTRPWRWPGFVSAWRASTRSCRRGFAAQRPAAVIGTGGFASGPAVATAARLGIATALLNPDLVPGRANRWLAGRVDCVFAQWPESVAYFPEHTRVEATGCPTRPAFAAASRAAGLARFGLDEHRRTLLVTGASLGAHSINQAMMRLAPELAAIAGWQVLHLTGPADEPAMRQAYRDAGVSAVVAAYTEHMADAMAAADLVVARAGASTLAELTAIGRPAILAPYPHHRDQHQFMQARLLVERGAARVCLDQADVMQTAALLRESLIELMTQEATRRLMQQRAAEAGAPHAADAVARGILALVAARQRAVER